jgi:hypothetical protein
VQLSLLGSLATRVLCHVSVHGSQSVSMRYSETVGQASEELVLLACY